MVACSWGGAKACWAILGARPKPQDQDQHHDYMGSRINIIGLDKQGVVFSWDATLAIQANHIPQIAPLQRIMDEIKINNWRVMLAMAERPLGITKWRGITVRRDR